MEEKTKNWLIGLGLILGIILLFSACSSGNKNSIDTDAFEKMNPEQKIDAVFKKLESNGNTILEKTVSDNYNRKDFEKWYKDPKSAPTQKIIFTKVKCKNFSEDHALVETVDFLKDLAKISEVYSVAVIWEADAVDKFGKTESSFINKLVFKHETFRKIVWDKVSPSNLPDIADDYNERPQFRKGE